MCCGGKDGRRRDREGSHARQRPAEVRGHVRTMSQVMSVEVMQSSGARCLTTGHALQPTLEAAECLAPASVGPASDASTGVGASF